MQLCCWNDWFCPWHFEKWSVLCHLVPNHPWCLGVFLLRLFSPPLRFLSPSGSHFHAVHSQSAWKRGRISKAHRHSRGNCLLRRKSHFHLSKSLLPQPCLALGFIGSDLSRHDDSLLKGGLLSVSPSGSPQRVNGKVKGRIFVGNSPAPIVFENTDLHSYVVMNHGRSYTAISTIPETIGYSLLPLAPIGGIIGWMFAVEQDGFKNGFSITGKWHQTLKWVGPGGPRMDGKETPCLQATYQ